MWSQPGDAGEPSALLCVDCLQRSVVHFDSRYDQHYVIAENHLTDSAFTARW